MSAVSRTTGKIQRLCSYLTVVQLPVYWSILGFGLLLGLYLSELLRFNLDFTGPRSPSGMQTLLISALAGPGLMMLVWLCSSLVVARLTRLTLPQALVLDARSYWPILLLGLSLVLSVILREPVTAYHAPVVLLVSVVSMLVCGLKAWLVEPFVLPSWRARITSRWLIVLAITVYVLVVGLLVCLYYRGYEIWGVDLGHFDQGLWNTWRGRPLQFTQYGGLDDSLLTDHVQPVSFLIAPLYLLWPDPRALLLLQVVALALGAWLAYRLALCLLPGRFAALCVALAYLVHPTIIGNGLDAGGSFRPDVLTIPLFLGTLLALEKRRWLWAVLLIMCAMACKEYIATVVVLLGLYVVYRYRRLWLGVGLSVAGALWLIGTLGIFLPWARGGEGSIHYQLNFGQIGGAEGISGVLSTLLTQPRLMVDLFLSFSDLADWLFALLSLAFLPLIDLPLMAVGAPILGLFTMVGIPDLFDFHVAPAFPFFLAAAIVGIARFAHWGNRRFSLSAPRLAVSLSALLLAASLSAAFFWSNGPLAWGFWSAGRPYTFWQNRFVVDEHDRRADRFVNMVPDEQPVIASDYLLSHLTQREHVYHFFDPPPPSALKHVDYAAIDLFETYIQPGDTGLRALVETTTGSAAATSLSRRVAGKDLYRQLLTNGEFGLAAFEDGLLLLIRKSMSAEGFSYAIDQVDRAEPSVYVGYDFGNRLRLIGYDLDGDPATLVTGQLYRVVYYWQVLEGFDVPFAFQYGVNPVDDVQQLSTDYVLIDTFTPPVGEPFRVVHMPTYLLLPPAEWQPGQFLREGYEFVLPEDLAKGKYRWEVGQYVVPHHFPIKTGPERWVPGTTAYRMSDVQLTGQP